MKDEIIAMFDSYPNFSECNIQTFDDDKTRKDKTLARIYPNTEENHKKIE
jgi:hypothetical protein